MFTQLHFVALACYGLTVAVVAVPFLKLREAPAPGSVPLVLTGVAVVAHFAGLMAYVRASGSLPLAGVAPSLSSLAFLLGLLALGIQWLTRENAIALVAGPLVVGVMAAALASGFGPAPLSPREDGAWFVIHAGSSLLGVALMALSFAAAALYLVQHRVLKRRQFGVLFQFLPPLEQLDRLNHLALVVGFPVLTIGIVLAAGYLGQAASTGGARSAHLVWGLLSWMILGTIAALRFRGFLKGRRAALASVLGFFAVATTYLVLFVAGAGGRFL
ncbi:MAG: hypothetical protein EXR93_00665 [Gemmatimonadetes bacterium]|nr:hypothetical protein [Gemmatimonadota bacterium]